jgi:hypothetical protein
MAKTLSKIIKEESKRGRSNANNVGEAAAGRG